MDELNKNELVSSELLFTGELTLSSVIKCNTPIEVRAINQGVEYARVGSDGIVHFMIPANDENARKFVECLQTIFKQPITGVCVTEAPDL